MYAPDVERRIAGSSEFARLEFGAFYFAVEFRLFTRLSEVNDEKPIKNTGRGRLTYSANDTGKGTGGWWI